MNFGIFWSLLTLARKKTPEAAVAVLDRLEPSKWHMSFDGEEVDSHGIPRFDVFKSAREQVLAVELPYIFDGKPHVLKGGTRFKNDGSDTLAIDGVPVTMPKDGYNLTSKPLRGYVEILMPYTDATGVSHSILLWNNF